jgi:hypothetical protein
VGLEISLTVGLKQLRPAECGERHSHIHRARREGLFQADHTISQPLLERVQGRCLKGLAVGDDAVLDDRLWQRGARFGRQQAGVDMVFAMLEALEVGDPVGCVT